MNCEVQNDAVVLIHGLAAPRWVMSPLTRFLSRRGYRVTNWGYPSVRFPVQAHVKAFRKELARIGATGVSQCHLVTHSMGGIVARCALAGDEPANLGRVVMLAPPNGGSRVARWLAPCFGFVCPPLTELSDEATSFVRGLPEPRGVDIGIIAAAADRVVSLESSHLDCERDHLVLPGHHGTLPLRRDVAWQVDAFLRGGRFERGDGHEVGSKA